MNFAGKLSLEEIVWFSQNMPTLRDKHPLKRKSVKPSSSTIRGMLPQKLFRALDASMQSLRAAGMRLEWQWKSEDIGWVCVGLYQDMLVCELHAAEEPLLGLLQLSPAQLDAAKSSDHFPAKFKKILEFPVKESKKVSCYEFTLESTPERDLFSNFIEAIEPILEIQPK